MHDKELLIRNIKTLANNLLEYLYKSYPKSKFQDPTQENINNRNTVCKSLYLTQGIDIKFSRWNYGKKPYFLVLYRDGKYIMEFDLSRVLFNENSRITWNLGQPTREENRENLKDLKYSYEQLDEEDIVTSQLQMKELNENANRTNRGYKFCVNDSIEEVQSKFCELIDHTILKGHNRDESSTTDGEEAIEGQNQERRYLSRKRNRDIVAKRKEMDEYTCQACDFTLETNGKYVIECHHLSPLRGVVVTRIEDLSCLCPTCHSIAHKNNPPYSIVDIKEILKDL